MAEYIPLSQLPSASDITPADLVDQSLPPLVWEFNLPPSVDAERLCINSNALRRYHKLGAFSSSVVLEYQGETSTYTPGVSGINADGSAIASRAGVKKRADTSDSFLIDPFDIAKQMLPSYGKATAVHRLNRPEIARRVVDDVIDKGVTSERAWAAAIDSSLRGSFRHTAKQHLKDRIFSPFVYLDYGLYSGWAIADGMLMAGGDVPVESALIWAGFQGLFTAFGAAMNKLTSGSTHIREKRWSIFYANHQSDRYAAVCAMSGISQLVGVRK